MHGSILNLILDEGELPSWNPYHMGGEPLVTPPGFHFFVSILILFSGMPLILAELVTAAFYSSIIVFPAYLISKKIWKNSSAGLLAAFFASFSALSLEMISWGGYTNIVSLSLIIIIFYLFFRDNNQPSLRNLLMGTLLFGSLIITHTFSLFVFFPILIFYLILLLIGKRQKLKDMKIKNTIRFFTVSVALGIVAVSPWILRVFNFYIDASSEGALTGGLEDNKNMILANRTVEIVILTLVIVIIPTLFMLKASRKRYVDRSSLLLIAWFLVPVVMTQAYLFGVYVDYSRFMYFIDFPGIIIISASLLYVFRYAKAAIKRSSRIKGNRIKKTVPVIVFTSSIFIFIIVSPWSIFPNDAMQRANFYTTIQEPEATALEWIRNKTPENSVLVADHLYGWWLSGIGERTTLSAAGLEFLLYSHELEVAKSAQLLLDTDYYIDNGIIQVREDDGYVSRQDPQFSIEHWSGESYPIFTFQDKWIEFWYEIHEYGKRVSGNTTLADMEIVEAPVISADENSANLTASIENDLFRVKKTVTVQRGVRFAEVSYNIEVKNTRTNLFNIWFPIYTGKGEVKTDLLTPMFGFYDPYKRACGQVIFKEDTPVEINRIEDEPIRVEMLYRYPWERKINIKMLIGVFDAQDMSYPYEVEQKYRELADSPLENVTLDPIFTWKYTEMIEEYDVSYVVCRDQTIYLKFSEDPNFRLMFNSGNVAIFQVIK